MSKSNQREELNQLFEQLQVAESQTSIDDLQKQIWEIWMQTGSPDINQLMKYGSEQLAMEAYNDAIKIFTEVVEYFPDYAEGWNKRATAYYLRGSFKASIWDICRTLALEPRHFGAISGLATIYMELGAEKMALATLQELKGIVPHQKGLTQQIESLCQKLGIKNTPGS
ncbi:hypothetical protein AAG747_17620 [Rapidithrix thailandica]|uniref:Tetratricopeptide repeat protein n=1 Tax=Rapidithrix thailandica TaxID=413964 RepID=A0AAW9RXV4_9BACT